MQISALDLRHSEPKGAAYSASPFVILLAPELRRMAGGTRCGLFELTAPYAGTA